MTEPLLLPKALLQDLLNILAGHVEDAQIGEAGLGQKWFALVQEVDNYRVNFMKLLSTHYLGSETFKITKLDFQSWCPSVLPLAGSRILLKHK